MSLSIQQQPLFVFHPVADFNQQQPWTAIKVASLALILFSLIGAGIKIFMKWGECICSFFFSPSKRSYHSIVVTSPPPSQHYCTATAYQIKNNESHISRPGYTEVKIQRSFPFSRASYPADQYHAKFGEENISLQPLPRNRTSSRVGEEDRRHIRFGEENISLQPLPRNPIPSRVGEEDRRHIRFGEENISLQPLPRNRTSSRVGEEDRRHIRFGEENISLQSSPRNSTPSQEREEDRRHVKQNVPFGERK